MEDKQHNTATFEQLQAIAEQYDLLLEQTPLCMALFDRNMCYLAASRLWKSLYGLEGRDLAGLSHYEVFPTLEEEWKEAHRRGLNGEVVRSMGDRITNPDGTSAWLRWEVKPWHNHLGEVAGIMLINENVTEQMRAQEDLRESRDRQQRIVQAANVGLWDWNLKTNEVYYSPEWKRQIGYEDWEIGNDFREWHDRVHPADIDPLLTQIRQLIEQHQLGFHLEFRFRHKDGIYRWMFAQASTEYDDAGNALCIRGSHLDITHKKLQEAEIKRLNELYLALSHVNQLITRAETLEQLFSGVCKILVQYGRLNLAWIGRYNAQTHGVEPVAYAEGASGSFNRLKSSGGDTCLSHGPIGAVLREQQAIICNGAVNTDCTKFCKEAGFASTAAFPIRKGARVHYALCVYAEEPDFFQGKEVLLFEEATLNLEFALRQLEQKTQKELAELVLRQSEERLRHIVESSNDWIWEVDAQGAYTYSSSHIEDLLGYKPEEILGKTPFDFMSTEEATRVAFLFLSLIEKRERFFQLENVNKHKDGHDVILETNGVPFFDEKGEFKGYRGMDRDITQRKKAEAELRETHLSLKATIDAVPDLLFEVDSRGQIFDYHSAWGSLYAPPEAFLNKTVSQILPPEPTGIIQKAIAQAAAEGTHRGATYVLDLPAGRCWFELSIATKAGAAGKEKRFIVLIRDITQRVQAEEEKTQIAAQLQQAQKMESIGRLAGGVAHDFNNMLGVILGHSEMALKQVAPSHPIHDNISEILNATKRSSDLTRQLLAFARRQTITPKVLDLNQTIAGMLKMLERMIGEHIALEWKPEAGLWPVKIDPSQIDQILANLCVNARDAITDIGRITIETANCALNQKDCSTHHQELAPGDYVRVSVTDTGCGMNEETLEHVFEPFFTTKPVGQGTGLGLATVYGTIRQNEGHIDIQSAPGQGTTISLYLPRDFGSTVELHLKEEQEAIKRNPVTVLLVEDEPAILRLTATILKSEGHTVLQARSPMEAIRIAQDYGHDIQLLVTDVVMPEMNGRNLAQKVQVMYPNIKCIYMSGYTADHLRDSAAPEQEFHFLQKPFSASDLTRMTLQVLDS